MLLRSLRVIIRKKIFYPVDTLRRFNVYKTSIRRLRRMSTGLSHAALRLIFISLLRSLPLVLEKKHTKIIFLIFYYIDWGMVMPKKLFQH